MVGAEDHGLLRRRLLVRCDPDRDRRRRRLGPLLVDVDVRLVDSSFATVTGVNTRRDVIQRREDPGSVRMESLRSGVRG